MTKVVIDYHNLELLEKYAESQTYEVCAMLIGDNEKNIYKNKDGISYHVEYIFFTENTEKSPVHFTISKEQLQEGYKIAANLEMDVIGIFHSHPNNKAYPSVTDERFMKINPGIWIIYSGIDIEFKAFTLDENEQPKEFRITDDS
jgi:proteasome lid subunit RPN8/RPN11